MRLDNVVVVGKREYLQRAKTKAFWVTTLILPLFVTAVSIVPSLLLSKSGSTQRIMVVDETGKLGPNLVKRLNSRTAQQPKEESKGLKRREDEGSIGFQATAEPPAADRAAQQAELNRRVLAKDLDAWVWLGPGVLADKPVEYHAPHGSNTPTPAAPRGEISAAGRPGGLRGARGGP